MTTKEIYPLAKEMIETSGRGITAKKLADALYGPNCNWQTKLRLGRVLSHLSDTGKLTRQSEENIMVYRLPGMAMPPTKKRPAGYHFITPAEMERAKARVQIGDVLPAEVYGASETVDTLQTVRTEVVVDYKSRWLIHCMDGSTFNYATLAMHYRNGRPLGRWDR